MHGARGGQGPGSLNPAYKYGGRTTETVELRRLVADLAREGQCIKLVLGR